MPINLKDFSPFVSHLICFFLGMALVLMKESSVEQGSFVGSKVYFPVKINKFFEYSKLKLESGQLFVIAKKLKETEEKLCVSSDKFLKVQYVQGKYFLSLNPKDVDQVSFFFKESYCLVSAKDAEVLPTCQQRPQVSYGTET